MARAKEFSLDLRKELLMPIVKEKATLSYQSASKCQERLSEESSRNSKKAVLYKTCLEEEGRQKFRKLLSES